jgi:SNF2 family DNA or RNA helicase
MKTTEVEEAKRRFQEWDAEEAPAIAVSIQAGGEGHTLTAAQDIALVQLPWTPTEVDQVVSRLHRIGQEGSVLATTFVADGTIDEDFVDILDSKRAVVEAATEGRTIQPSATVGDIMLRFAGLD